MKFSNKQIRVVRQANSVPFFLRFTGELSGGIRDGEQPAPPTR